MATVNSITDPADGQNDLKLPGNTKYGGAV